MGMIVCRRCGKPIKNPQDHICKTHVGKRNNGKRYVGDIRSTSRWQKKRLEILEEQNYICLVAFALGDKEYLVAEQVHHIVGIKEDESLALDNDNLIGLSKFYHDKVEDKKELRKFLRMLKQEYEEGKLEFGCYKGKIIL
ncbi:MAG: hypothetical protein E6789_02520 [Clostridium baratii]|nr:hypothetical protein [Clostridium baratii]